MPGRLLQARVVQDGFVLPGGAATKAAHVVAGCVHVTLCGRAQDVREQLLGSLTRKSRSQLHPSTYNVQQVPVDMQTLLVVRYAPPPQILPAHTDNEWNDASTVMKSGRILPILAIRLDYLPNSRRHCKKKSNIFFILIQCPPVFKLFDFSKENHGYSQQRSNTYSHRVNISRVSIKLTMGSVNS